jgi:hypothetical protein
MRLAYLEGIAPEIAWRTYCRWSIAGLPHVQGLLCSGLREPQSE